MPPKKLCLGFLIGLWMPLCVLAVYLMTKQRFRVRQINWEGR